MMYFVYARKDKLSTWYMCICTKYILGLILNILYASVYDSIQPERCYHNKRVGPHNKRVGPHNERQGLPS